MWNLKLCLIKKYKDQELVSLLKVGGGVSDYSQFMKNSEKGFFFQLWIRSVKMKVENSSAYFLMDTRYKVSYNRNLKVYG